MELLRKIWANTLARNIILILLCTIIMGVLVSIFLRVYTHHGQKLVLPEYVGMVYHEAQDIADKNDYELVVDDSVHIVGKAGGEILRQNPVAGSAVKEGRKVYVTIAKYNADKFLSGQLSEMYGTKFDLKAKELSTLFKMDCRVVGKLYDPGPVDHILEVRHKGKPIENRKGRNKKVEIERGGVLEFILSSKEGGKADVPDLKCLTLAEAKFKIATRRLKVGNITPSGDVMDEENAYVVAQEQAAQERIPMGSTVDLTIQQEKPADCQ